MGHVLFYLDGFGVKRGAKFLFVLGNVGNGWCCELVGDATSCKDLNVL